MKVWRNHIAHQKPRITRDKNLEPAHFNIGLTLANVL